MATHSTILAWRIPWTEKPGGLQSMGQWGRKESDTTELLTLLMETETLGAIGDRRGPLCASTARPFLECLERQGTHSL